VLDQDWLSRCEYNVTGWAIMFICGHIILVCWHLQSRPGIRTSTCRSFTYCCV